MKKPSRTLAPRLPRQAPHEVRIIGGQFKRSKLPVLNHPDLRPTPDRVRQTLFDWLGQDLHGRRCVDAFAGTGALGFEAASRGAADVVLVEQDIGMVQAMQRVKTKLAAHAVHIERGDGLSALEQRRGAGLDVVFLDPPFATGHDAAFVGRLLDAARAALGPAGAIYLEAPRVWAAHELAPWGLDLHRQGRAGQVAFHLLRPLA